MTHPLPPVVGCVLTTALLLSGCATSEPRPTQTLAMARAAVTEAESAGARDTAPVLLDQARTKVDRARTLMDQDNNGDARRLLEQATADARLAKARAGTAQVQQAVDELNETIRMLRERMLEEQS